MSGEIKDYRLRGNEFADSFFGRFMAWLGERPTLAPVLVPGAVVGALAILLGVPPMESVAVGGGTALGLYAIFTFTQ